MPKIKTKREDVLRHGEIDEMLLKAEKGNIRYRNEAISFSVKCVKCLIALLWLFGKRISETLLLKRKDVWEDGKYLYVRFHVLKKKAREEQAIASRKLKRITLDNPYVKCVVDYVNGITELEAPLFPSNRSRNGCLSRSQAYKIVKGLNAKAWLHLFRHSLATTMAEEGATEEELMHWFDWDRHETAHGYVRGGPRLTEKWSKRTW